MLLSAKMQTHESRLRLGRIAALPVDMGLVHPDYSAIASLTYAAQRELDHQAQGCKGYSQAAVHGHPKHSDECHHLAPAASVETESATKPPTRAHLRERVSEISLSQTAHGSPGGTQCRQPPAGR